MRYQKLRVFLPSLGLVLALFTQTAKASPSLEQAERELPYLRMSLVMNAVLHLVQYPLSLDGKLKLPPERAFVSFGGGLVYATTAGLTFSTHRKVQHAGIGTFMGVSVGGAGFVTGALINCTVHRARTPRDEREPMGCRARFFDALNAAILLNQIAAWTLGVRQFSAKGSNAMDAIEMPLLETRF